MRHPGPLLHPPAALRRRWILPLAAVLALWVCGTGTQAEAGGTMPRLMVLGFSSPPSGGVPIDPAFRGLLSREIPREIGRRMVRLADLETRFYAIRVSLGEAERFLVVEKMLAPEEARLIGRQGGAAFVLDGRVALTDRLRIVTRLQDVASGRRLWLQRYEAPPAEAAALLERAARDLLTALPGHLGDRARSAPLPGHEPSWPALLAYMRGENARFARESGLPAGSPSVVFAYFLDALQCDPGYDAAREALVADAHQALREGSVPLDVALAPLRRLVALRPDAVSYAALARGLALAERPRAADAAWRKSVAADPGFVEGWLHVAEAREREGKYREAAQALEKALALGLPTVRVRARVRRDLGGLYLTVGEIDRAIAALEASARENPRDPETFFRLGAVYDRKKALVAPAEAPAWAQRAWEAFQEADRLQGFADVPSPSQESRRRGRRAN
jgi:tetratricopeptide (TPR) repeat protein